MNGGRNDSVRRCLVPLHPEGIAPAEGVGACPLGDCLMDLWAAYPETKRWAEMLYTIRGKSFEANFLYASDFDPKEWPMERRSRLVKEHFGDKPVIYPPLQPDGTDEVYTL